MYFLDTNICIHFLNGSSDSIRNQILSLQPVDIKIPVIVSAELLFGAKKSTRVKENHTKVQRFLKPFEIISFTSSMSHIYAELRYYTEKKGTPVGPNDLLIASIVKSENGTLVTKNTREFAVIDGLKLTEW